MTPGIHYTRGLKLDAVLKPDAGVSAGRGRPRPIPAKYYHDGLYPARCKVRGPDVVSAKSPLTQTNVGKSVRANLDGLLSGGRIRGFFLSLLDIPLSQLGCLVTTTKVAAGTDCRPTPGSPMVGGVHPAQVTTLRRNGRCCRQPNPPGSDLYIQRGIYP